VPRYAAFLRGINVSGRRVKGPALCAPFAALGLEDVATFRASGNVVFSGPRQAVDPLTARIEEALEAALGYHVAVFLRTASRLRAIAEHRPFPPARFRASDGKLQVSLLSRRPTPAAQREVLALATADDPLAFGERELYWLPRGGMLESELDLDAIERRLGPTTRRTQGTLELMAAKHFPA
jgi:uncharacterized protein (DUF1697 family)